MSQLGSGERFKALVDKVKKNGYSDEAARKIAASVGIKKYGKEKMQQLAQAGKKK